MVDRDRSEDFIPKHPPLHIANVDWERFCAGSECETQHQRLSDRFGPTRICVANEILPPGKLSTYHHYHTINEEHVFVLEGEMTLCLGSKSYILVAGSYVCFPTEANIAHSLFNHSKSNCRYLAISNPDSSDVIVFPDRNEVSLKALGLRFNLSSAGDNWQDNLTGGGNVGSCGDSLKAKDR